ncbi:MAG: signal peptidase II, partial [Bdellovibrionales bacterium]
GMLRNDTNYGPYLLVGLSFVIVIGFLVWMFRTRDKVHQTGIALIIGGALGNVIDRFRFGAVFDFLDFHIADLHWPAFNVADSCICVGVFILMIYAFLFEKTASSAPVN